MYRLFFVLISLLVSQSFAADVTNLYQSSIPVSSQGKEERVNVAPEVLQQVILKVVGDRSILETVDISPLLAQPEKLLQQYQYHRINIVGDDLTQPDQLEIVLSFNEDALNDSLTQIGLPIWASNRPEVIIWLAIEEGKKRTILSADNSEQKITKALNDSATSRGLPILLPVMDIQDQSQVTYTDLWAGFSETVETASERYGAPVILMVKAQLSDKGLLRADWHARINGESEQWQSRGDADTAIKAGIDELTDRLSRRYSQVETEQYERNLLMEISGVQSYADYVRLESYLTKLQNVAAVQLSNLTDDKLTINLTFMGDLDVFNRALAVDSVLIEQSLNVSAGVKSYRLSL